MKKPSTIFEGKDSSLRKTFDELADISICKKCWAWTPTIKGKCDKCKKIKQ